MQDNIKRSKVPNKDGILTDVEQLKTLLMPLVGMHFPITRKARTDGSNFRKLITNTIMSGVSLEEATMGSYEIQAEKSKGLPKFLSEYIDTYVVTTGGSYNLQVWNRNPYTEMPQVIFSNGKVWKSSDVRFILGKLDVKNEVIESILITSPKYINDTFGKFGKPTIKEQMLISGTKREQIINSPMHAFITQDENSIAKVVTTKKISRNGKDDIRYYLGTDTLISLNDVEEIINDKLVGYVFTNTGSTKQMGQELERLVGNALGYTVTDELILMGGYPDIPAQLIEVKVQETQTVDLGKYSPQFEEEVTEYDSVTTAMIRYIIALTNPDTHVIEGVIYSSGAEMVHEFTFVSGMSYKSQRSIPMSIFDKMHGKVIIK